MTWTGDEVFAFNYTNDSDKSSSSEDDDDDIVYENERVSQDNEFSRGAESASAEVIIESHQISFSVCCTEDRGQTPEQTQVDY